MYSDPHAVVSAAPDEGWVRKPDHPHGEGRTSESCKQGYEQGDLERSRPSFVVYAQDLSLNLRRLALELLLKARVTHHLSVVL